MRCIIMAVKNMLRINVFSIIYLRMFNKMGIYTFLRHLERLQNNLL